MFPYDGSITVRLPSLLPGSLDGRGLPALPAVLWSH